MSVISLFTSFKVDHRSQSAARSAGIVFAWKVYVLMDIGEMGSREYLIGSTIYAEG
jgi:hypothetical protein